MKSNSKTLGDIIKAVDERNSDEKTKEVLGISINKEFMPSVANIIGTDLSKYKLLRKSRFAFNSMHTGRDERLPIALFKRDDIAIVSPAYFMFEIKSKDEVDEDYLMIWFQRPEFDHICWYMTDASVRGGLSWDDFCRITIELPSIEEQRKIVHDYKVIVDRIELLKKVNCNLEEEIKTLIRKSIDENGKSVLLEDYCNIFTGKKDVNQAVADGKYNFYSCSPEPVKSNEYIYKGEAILVAGNGSYTGRTIYVNDTFDLYQRTYAIVAKNSESCIFYIFYALLQTIFQDAIESKLHGSAIPYIVYNDLAKIEAKIKGDLDFLGDAIKSILKHEHIIKNEIYALLNIRNSLLNKLSKEVG